jgi:hypothetical protein
MRMIKAKIEYRKHPVNDEYYTPVEAVEFILPYIPTKVNRIWECTAVTGSNIVRVLRQTGYSVIETHINTGFDFLRSAPIDFDMVISNPPYSKKDEFLQRMFELKKPFMFLLPITALEGVKRHKLFKEHGIQLIIPDCRFKFKPGGSGAWFQTSWFTFGLNLERDLNFVPMCIPMDLPPEIQGIIPSHGNINKGYRQAA